MHPALRLCCIALIAWTPAALRAVDGTVIDAFADVARWSFDNGQEFPGASGSLKKADGAPALELHYDFTGGGYVQALYKGALPRHLRRVTFTAVADADSVMKFRLITVDGRCFQTAERQLARGRPATVAIDVDGPWAQAWGGAEAKTPQAEIKGIAILATRKGAKTGAIRISDLMGQAKP